MENSAHTPHIYITEIISLQHILLAVAGCLSYVRSIILTILQ